MDGKKPERGLFEAPRFARFPSSEGSPMKTLRSFLLFVLAAVFLSGGCTRNEDSELFNEAVEFWKNEEYENSIQNFITLTKTHPNSRLTDDSLFWIAGIYNHYLQEPQQAIRYYRALSKKRDSEYYKDAMRELADIYLNSNTENRNRAILIYRKLQSLDLDVEKWEENQYRIVNYYLDSGDYELARVELKKFAERTNDPAWLMQIYRLIGFSYYIEGNLALAEKTYREAFEKFPEADTGLNLVNIYQETQKLDRALSVLKALQANVTLDPPVKKLLEKQIENLGARMAKLD